MPIKLLKKNEIDVLKARERHEEIEQGKKLAERVDNLRRIASEEEQSLATFRTKTVAEINNEITNATAQRDTILREVEQLRIEQAVGMQLVLDAQNQLHNENEEMHATRTALQAKVSDITEREKVVHERERLTRNKQIEIDLTLEDSLKRLEHTRSLQKEARGMYVKASIEKKNLESLKMQAGSEFMRREAALAEREKMVQMRRESVDAKERHLRDRERALADTYTALEQAQKHTKIH